MTKNDLLETFPTVSPSAIKIIDDEYEIVGKFFTRDIKNFFLFIPFS